MNFSLVPAEIPNRNNVKLDKAKVRVKSTPKKSTSWRTAEPLRKLSKDLTQKDLEFLKQSLGEEYSSYSHLIFKNHKLFYTAKDTYGTIVIYK